MPMFIYASAAAVAMATLSRLSGAITGCTVVMAIAAFAAVYLGAI